MGEWGYGVGEREGRRGCYEAVGGGRDSVHRGIWMLLGGKGGGGWWMGGVTVRIRYFLLCPFSAFRKLWRWGFGNPRLWISAMTSPHQIDPSDIVGASDGEWLCFVSLFRVKSLWVGTQAIVPLSPPPPPHFISRRLLSLSPAQRSLTVSPTHPHLHVSWTTGRLHSLCEYDRICSLLRH
jgi:hypothetical protein